MPAYSLRQADNGVWYIHWTEGRRSKRESTGQKEKTAAQIYLGEWLLGLTDGAAGGDHLMRDLWSQYFKRHVEKTLTSATPYETAWNNLELHFGDLTVSAVTNDQAEAYTAKRLSGRIGQRPAKSSTVRRELSVLLMCFNWCAKPEQKLIAKADVPAFALPDGAEPRDRWLRADEIQKLLRAAAELRPVPGVLSRAERFLWLALETAARKTAILELTWDRVDFDMAAVHYNVPGRRKTKKRRGSPPISTTLMPILKRAYGERSSDLVCGDTGDVNKAIIKIAKLAGVAGVTPHVLRHTAATHMLRRGVPVWIVAGILANTVDMVEKVYGHISPDGLRAGVEAISNGALEPAE